MASIQNGVTAKVHSFMINKADDHRKHNSIILLCLRLTNAGKIVRAAVVVRFTRDVTEASLIVFESTTAAILTHATVDVETRDVTNRQGCKRNRQFSTSIEWILTA